MPDALVSTALLPSLAGNPLAPTASRQESASGLHSDAYRRALAEAHQDQQKTFWEMFTDLVREEGPGGVSYSIYFLAAAGMLLGLIVCVVGYSYYVSTRGVEVEQNRNTEDDGSAAPLPMQPHTLSPGPASPSQPVPASPTPQLSPRPGTTPPAPPSATPSPARPRSREDS